MGFLFDKKEIEDAELLEDLPEEDFVRINGLSDSRQLLGKFKGEESGKAMFLYPAWRNTGFKIKLPEYTVFSTVKNPGKCRNGTRNFPLDFIFFRDILLLKNLK